MLFASKVLRGKVGCVARLLLAIYFLVEAVSWMVPAAVPCSLNEARYSKRWDDLQRSSPCMPEKVTDGKPHIAYGAQYDVIAHFFTVRSTIACPTCVQLRTFWRQKATMERLRRYQVPQQA